MTFSTFRSSSMRRRFLQRKESDCPPQLFSSVIQIVRHWDFRGRGRGRRVLNLEFRLKKSGRTDQLKHRYIYNVNTCKLGSYVIQIFDYIFELTRRFRGLGWYPVSIQFFWAFRNVGPLTSDRTEMLRETRRRGLARVISFTLAPLEEIRYGYELLHCDCRAEEPRLRAQNAG